MKFYKILLKLIQIAVVLVVLPRVSEFVGQLGPPTPMHDVIRVAFALTLGLGTISTSYFANDQPPPEYDDEPPNPRERKRREREAVFFATMLNAAPAARKAMILFAFLDGTFNLADAVRGAYQNGMFDVAQQGQALTSLYLFATVLFGLAPTILAMMLSYVISLVDRIPMDYERPPTNKREIDWVRTVMGNLGFREFRAGEALAVPDRRPILPPRIERPITRSPGRPNGEQQARIFAYLDEHATADHMPSVRSIQADLDDPKPSISTISDARRVWLNRYDPWQQQAKESVHGNSNGR